MFLTESIGFRFTSPFLLSNGNHALQSRGAGASIRHRVSVALAKNRGLKALKVLVSRSRTA